MKRRVLAALIALCLCALGGCAAQVPKEKYQMTWFDLFDTVTMMSGYAESQEAFSQQAEAFHDGMMRYHMLYDIYNDYGGLINLKTVNDRAGEAVKVGPEIIDLLKLAKEIAAASGGKTDVTLGSMLYVWHNAREAGLNDPENAALPDESELEAAMAHTGIDLLEIDEAAGTVRLTDPEARLDVGALAKGFAVQQVCDKMPSGYMVSVGGNVCTTGPKPEGALWTVGVQDPDGTGSDYLHIVCVSKGAVVTSGDYQRYYVADGKRLHHLIDPETRMPGDRWRAVTVICDDSGIADALSTSLFLSDIETGKELLKQFKAEACWMAADGTVSFSDGYGAYIKK